VSSEIDGVRGGALLDEAPIEARQALASLLHQEDLGRDSGVRGHGSVLPYGSHLAQSGLDPVGVQRQMGHARPSITMDLYVHEFETARRREQVSDRLTAALGGLVESDIF
jgi:integrase